MAVITVCRESLNGHATRDAVLTEHAALTRGKPVHPMVGAGTLAEYSLVREAQAVAIPRDGPLELAS